MKPILIPTIPEIQETLVRIGDKPKSFLNSREWIGSVEVGMIIDTLYDVPCKIIHVASGNELKNIGKDLIQHFKEKGSPIMMGGNNDCSSKGIMGVYQDDDEIYFLVLDPHYVGKCSVSKLVKDGWVKWVNITDFSDCSFYNLCLPMLSFCEK